ncbi:RHS repeat-associated core domain-containing protein [Paenibacillus sp. 19GGS1-52]|uniref:RHS repeat-associated core domain-containing protein n=1 Tax=Paenibacillus sp. 19GGS1-52 TaxID=2758563 RepID=UPI001EFB9156|nr:RHS repeat-associated core domain-containing protein [Paenibacillus sp. 19GGS1-52]
MNDALNCLTKFIRPAEEISNPFKYTVELYDEETGLYYLRARYYDPSMGRFLNEDTYEGQIDNPLSQNLYTYVSNNPLMYADPSGHKIEQSYGYDKFLNPVARKDIEDYQRGWQLLNQMSSKQYNKYVKDTGKSKASMAAGASEVRNNACNYQPSGCMGGTAEFVYSGDGYLAIDYTSDEGLSETFILDQKRGVLNEKDALLRVLYDNPNNTASLNYIKSSSNSSFWINVGNLKTYISTNGYVLGSVSMSDMFKVDILNSRGSKVGELHVGQTHKGANGLRYRDHFHPAYNMDLHLYGDDEEYPW